MTTFRIDRRQFVVATAALAATSARAATGWEAVAPTLFLCDRQCSGLLRDAERRQDILWFNGDVTALWSGTLRPLWRTGEARVAGVTRAPALFCLEQLARGMRHRVLARETLIPSNAVRWLIAPAHSGGLV